MPRRKKNIEKDFYEDEPSMFQRLQSQIQLDQSYLSLALGLVIVLIAGFLVFNYFKGNKATLGPAQQTADQNQADVKPENLPGKYTVKEDDTLFSIAEKYYNDGYKYTEISSVNSIIDPNNILVGQVLEIPKLEEAAAVITPTETAVGDADNQTIWGAKIDGTSYTVVQGDWLSKIAGRAYGDIMAFDKIAKANNIYNPDLIEIGTVLQIPR